MNLLRRGLDARVARMAIGAWVGLVLALGQAGLVAAAQAWTVSANTLAVPLSKATVVRLTITNRSDNSGGGSAIECVRVSIPSEYSISSVTMVSVSHGPSWTARETTSPRGVMASAAPNGDRLEGDPQYDRLVLDVTVVGKIVGASAWTANEFKDVECDSDSDYHKPVLILMTVLGLPIGTPTPTPQPTPRPTPTPTPEPTPTPTPRPTSTPSATPSPTSSPGPTGSPMPTPTPTPPPNPRGTPNPTPAPTPTPTPVGGGLGASGGGASSGAPGSGGSGGGSARPTPGVGIGDPGKRPDDQAVTFGDIPGLGLFDWAVPGVLLTGPGFLLLLLIAAQATGALAWLPIVRRKIGAFGVRRRHPAA